MQDKKNDNKKNKKKRLLNLVRESKFIKNKIIIMSLLEDNKLDGIIKKIADCEILIPCSSLIKKEKISHLENFLCFLDSFITYYIIVINDYSIINDAIVGCLNVKESNILLKKVYPYDEDNLNKIKDNYKLMIISNFYHNIKKIDSELSTVSEILDVNNISITRKKDIDLLINLLQEICFVNKDSYYLLALFTKVEDNTFDIYLSYYDRLLSKYIDNIDFVKEYREFKKKNNIYL